MNSMDIIGDLMNATVLDGSVIVRFVLIALILELFGICSYWLRRF